MNIIFHLSICPLGADLSDYFNYGFTEDTWAAYCARQKRIRLNESGVGLPNSSGSSSIKRIAPQENQSATSMGKPNTSGIAVLTADKREYSKKNMFEGMPDFSRPPPGMNVPPPGIPPNFNAPPPSGEDFDATEESYDYYGGYEPTQESQWVAPPSTYGGDGPPPNSDAPPGDAGYDDKRDPWQRNGRRSSRESPSRDRKRRRSRSRSRDREYRYREYRDRDRDRDRERDRDRDRKRERDRDRDRERDRDRDRKRDRSRSRDRDRDSRSPSGHRHKKSKKDKREKGERDIKREVKEEPEDYVE